jgi:hypothetical protein
MVSWADPTPPAVSLGNPGNEIGFKIERSTDGGSSWTKVGDALANKTYYADAFTATAQTRYRVIAWNAAANSTPSATATPGDATAVAVSTITISGGAPARVGTPVIWTVQAGGGIPPLEYQFFVISMLYWSDNL